MTDIKTLLNARGLAPNKSLGQNFLISEDFISQVVMAVNPRPDDTILEIGAGLGSLTVPLAQGAGRVIAVELDRVLAGVLSARLNELGVTNTDIIIADFMRVCMSNPQFRATKVAGALPYHITTEAIRKLYTMRPAPESITLVIQKEAAEKLTAAPGSAGYCTLTLETAYFASVETVADAPPSCFYPQPNVRSRAVRLVPFIEPPVKTSRRELFRVIASAFSTRRKTLLNCLSAGLNIPRDAAASFISRCGFASNIRGERLSLSDFDRLALEILSAGINI